MSFMDELKEIAAKLEETNKGELTDVEKRVVERMKLEMKKVVQQNMAITNVEHCLSVGISPSESTVNLGKIKNYFESEGMEISDLVMSSTLPRAFFSTYITRRLLYFTVKL